MTIDEFKHKLDELDDEQFRKFNDELGGGQKTREERVREFVHDPKHERRICQLLGLKTEDEKLTEAALKSAKAAATSAKTAIISCIVSIAAAIVAVISLIIGCLSNG